MKLFDPDPKLRWLFAMTHPDDEISICGWIRRLSALGIEIHLSWSHKTPEREWEARQVSKLLHVPSENLHFHHGPDRCLERHMAFLLPSFARMFDMVKPDRVVAGAFEQGHLDHDATNLLVNTAFDGVVLETPFYHAYCRAIPTMNRFASTVGEELLELLPHEVQLKRRVAQSYPSQAIWSNLVWYRALQTVKGEKEPVGSVERLRVQTHKDFREPNLPGPLSARIAKSGRWRQWLEAVDAFAEATSPAIS
jgi:LmbE family N-acetylglucosaminyl deacetylase